MKGQIIEQIAQGNTEEAIETVEGVLETLKDEYYKWVALKSRFGKLKSDSIKGTVAQEDMTLETNKIQALVMEYYKDLDNTIREHFQESEQFSLNHEGFRDRLQSRLMEKYQLQELLGLGDSTVYYKAKQWKSDRLVTIKAWISQNFTHEAAAFSESERIRYFKHRNIRTVIDDAGAHEVPKYVILEYIDGSDLRAIVEKTGPRPVYESKRLLHKICDALYYLHKRKNFSSDLRPNRIMIDEEGEPIMTLVTGFKTRIDANYSEILSDFQYMSPERLSAKNGILEDDVRSNQFSLGVLAYFLVTGEHLFSGESLTEVINQRQRFSADPEYRQAKFDQLRGPEDFTGIIVKLLSLEKKKRYANIKAVIDALDSCKVPSRSHYEVTRESYQRCIALNPDFIGRFLDTLTEKLPVAKERLDPTKIDRKRLEIMLHNSINLMIETNVDDSYMDKIRQIKGHKGLNRAHYTSFFGIFLEHVAECDYMWSNEIKKSWDLTLEESIDDLDR
ncbi:MAG: hypothetical protein EP344_02745 [Bacteroidetes bacterium]|nr:MAG: hypothetical protein EP344_02745 [Bacteroidota bacterium]